MLILAYLVVTRLIFDKLLAINGGHKAARFYGLVDGADWGRTHSGVVIDPFHTFLAVAFPAANAHAADGAAVSDAARGGWRI